MDDKQYDMPPEMLKLFKQKQQQRNESKAYYQRLIENPHRPVGDGAPFDPVLHRFNALSSYAIEYFRPSPRNIVQVLAILVIPVIGFTGLFRHFRMKNDRMYRDGKVAYKDRMFKIL